MSGVCWYGVFVLWGEMYDKSTNSSANGADQSEGCWMREMLWLCGEFGIDNAFDRDLYRGRDSWFSGGGQTGFNEDCIYVYPLSFAGLVEEVSCVWYTCDEVDSGGEVVTLLHVVQDFSVEAELL